MIALDQLSALEAESLSLSIRPVSGGLAFAIHKNEKATEESPHSELDGSILSQGFLPSEGVHGSWVEAIEELFFQHQGLTLPFYELHLYCEPSAVTLVPKEFFSPGEERLWLGGLVGSIPRGEELAFLSHQLKEERKVLIFSYPEALCQFLRRMYPRINIVPYFVRDLELVCRSSRQTSDTIFTCSIRSSKMDVYVVRGGNLIALNTFGFVSGGYAREIAEEVAYYIFTLWRDLQLSGQTDSLRLLYTDEESTSTREVYKASQGILLPLLQSRIRQISLEYANVALTTEK